MSLTPPMPPGFRPRIGVRGMLSRESPWPCEGLIWRGEKCGRPGPRLLYGGLAPPLLDSQPRIGVRGVLLIAGMTRWAAGAYPGSWSGTCFHSNRSCRLSPAHEGMKMRPGRWRSLGATPPLWIPAPYRGTGHAFDRRNDEAAAGGIQAYLRLHNIIFVPIVHAGCRRHTKL